MAEPIFVRTQNPKSPHRPIVIQPTLEKAGTRPGIRFVRAVAAGLMLLAVFTSSRVLHAQPPLRIAAAADLQPVLPPILDAFQKATGIHAEAAYQASAALTVQIQNGAPFDVFLSADMSYPQRLMDGGLAEVSGAELPAGVAGKPAPMQYARGTLVLWARKNSHWPAPSLATLKDPALQRLAIANPERAPYGRAAIAALTSLKLIDSLRPRLVTAENIAQAAQFAESGNADAGLISLTSAMTPQLQSEGSYFVVPRDLYPPIEQGAVLLKATSQRSNCQKFLAFLRSPAVQQQLGQSGLAPAH